MRKRMKNHMKLLKYQAFTHGVVGGVSSPDASRFSTLRKKAFEREVEKAQMIHWSMDRLMPCLRKSNRFQRFRRYLLAVRSKIAWTRGQDNPHTLTTMLELYLVFVLLQRTITMNWLNKLSFSFWAIEFQRLTMMAVVFCDPYCDWWLDISPCCASCIMC